jgi:hypothetical protein
MRPRSPTSVLPAPVLLLVLAALLAACTGAPAPGPVATATADPSPSASQAQTLTAAEGMVDDDVLDTAVADLLALLNASGAADVLLDAATYEDAFAPDFRAQAPRSDIVGLLEAIRPLGPFTSTTELNRSEVGEVLLRATAEDGTAISIGMTVTPAGQVRGLQISQESGPSDGPSR